MSLIWLRNRTVISISGDDRLSFLQGLITNDLAKLSDQQALYSCFLTPQGKFLYDFFILEDGDRYLLDVEAERAASFLQQLSFYKLRSNVTLEDLSKQYRCYALLGNEKVEGAYDDPRLPLLGKRLITDKEMQETAAFDIYDQWRIQCAVPDGARDLKPQFSTLHEGNLDCLNAISFDKGCYLGQELTARIEHRGLVKKRLFPQQQEDGTWQLILVKLDQIEQENVVVPDYLQSKI